MPIVIAIDGPAGAGKSTVARRVADRLGFIHIDTGAMYRAVALWAVRLNVDPSDAHRMEQLARAASIELKGENVYLNGEDVSELIRTPEISAAASIAATVPGLRRALVEKQREMGSRADVVMEGRDVGSVVFPDAGLKIFLDADHGERARRRQTEVAQMHERDQRDRARAEAPLTQAPDAVYLDSTRLSPEEVEEAILGLFRSRFSNGKEQRAKS